MNYSLAVFLINKTVRAVGVSYEPDPTRTDTAKAGSITIYKTIDQSLAVKDLVIVPTNTRWGFTVGRVEELDVDVNFDSQTQMDWIVDTADRAAFQPSAAPRFAASAKNSPATSSPTTPNSRHSPSPIRRSRWTRRSSRNAIQSGVILCTKTQGSAA